MASSTSKTVIILAAVLAAVLIVSVLAIMLVSGPSVEMDNDTEAVKLEFDLSPLQRPEYVQLNRQLIVEGAIPVTPPSATGKAIPFL